MSTPEGIPFDLLINVQRAIENTFIEPCLDCQSTEMCKHRQYHQAHEAIKAVIKWSEEQEAKVPAKALASMAERADQKIWVDCPACNGTGGKGDSLQGWECTECEGTGETQVDAPKTLFVQGLRATWDGIFKEVEGERVNQFELWGIQRHDWPKWISILGEEFGESAKEANKSHWGTSIIDIAGHRHGLREELIQTIAVAVAMVEHIDEIDEQEDNNVYASPE